MSSLQRKTVYPNHYYHLEYVIVCMTESISHQEEFEPKIVDNMPNRSRQAHYYKKQDSYRMSVISDRFLSLYTVAITVHRLIRENASSTKRGLYYMHAGLFQDQKIVDSAAGRALLSVTGKCRVLFMSLNKMSSPLFCPSLVLISDFIRQQRVKRRDISIFRDAISRANKEDKFQLTYPKLISMACSFLSLCLFLRNSPSTSVSLKRASVLQEIVSW